MALSINSTVLTIVSVATGLILVGSLLAPVAQSVMDDLTHETDGIADYTEGGTWASLISVLVLFAVIGLLIVAVNGYTGGKK